MPALLETYPATPEAPGLARRAVGSLGLPEPPAHDLRLLVSELVTNSVLHSGASDEDTIGLKVSRRPGRVYVEVRDDGPGFEGTPRDPGPMDPGGRGLLLVDRMALEWGVGHDEQTCVWFEMTLDDDGRRGL